MPGSEETKESAPPSKVDDAPSQDNASGPEDVESMRFSPEEEASLVQESASAKADANSLFSSGDYHNALARYEDALASCPRYLHYPRAVLHSNVAACHLKLEAWEPTIKAAGTCLDALAKLEEPKDAKDASGAGSGGTKSETRKKDDDDDDAVEEEIISSGASRAAPSPSTTSFQPSDVLRIRTKALLRRARARSNAGGWSNLSGAEQDYRALAALPPGTLTPADAAVVRAQLRDVPPRAKAAQEAEMAEMWGKLRQLGDGILKPFGLSTQNFQMVKDEQSGGYSMNFTQGGPSSK